MNDSDFSIGFKQGQEHGKQIMLEKIDAIKAEIQALPKTYPFVNHIDTYVKDADVIKIIERHCGGDKK